MLQITDSKGNEVEVFEFDLGKYNWKEANGLCKNLGENWRLPTTDELRLIYENLHCKKLGNFEEDIYWSSETLTDFGNKKIFDMIGMAKIVNLRYGHIKFPEEIISKEYLVRPVKYLHKKVSLEFHYRCRECLIGSSTHEMIMFDDFNIPFKYGQSEYFAGEKLKELLNKNCNHCFSKDIEYFDIMFNKKSMFEEKRFNSQFNDYFEIFLDNENGVISTNISGAKYLSNKFKQKLIIVLKSLLNKYLNDTQNMHNYGNFHFLFRGYVNNGNQAFRTERLINSGIPYIELEKIITRTINILETL
ncbi:hypothetical protein [Flavobacterium sp.]|jgi:hypothetical protein|uniref:hypothetical protein n=1 Tax=Flavobacterium sp. TaxID=239 RepID=UPI0037BF06A4